MTRSWLESLRRVGLGPENVLIFTLDAESKQTLAEKGIDAVPFENSPYGETPTGVVEYRESCWL